MNSNQFVEIFPFLSILFISFMVLIILLLLVTSIRYRNLDIVYYVKRCAILEAEVVRLKDQNKSVMTKLDVQEKQLDSNDKIESKTSTTKKAS